jgi:hypothetical protein
MDVAEPGLDDANLRWRGPLLPRQEIVSFSLTFGIMPAYELTGTASPVSPHAWWP